MDNSLNTEETSSPQIENSSPTIDSPADSNPSGFNIEEYESNLEDNSISEDVLRYQTLIKNQDQLINNLRSEIRTLKEKNLSLANSVSTVDTLKPETTSEILAKAFLGKE